MLLFTLVYAFLTRSSKRRKCQERLAYELERLTPRGLTVVIIPMGFGLCSGTKGRV